MGWASVVSFCLLAVFTLRSNRPSALTQRGQQCDFRYVFHSLYFSDSLIKSWFPFSSCYWPHSLLELRAFYPSVRSSLPRYS